MLKLQVKNLKSFNIQTIISFKLNKAPVILFVLRVQLKQNKVLTSLFVCCFNVVLYSYCLRLKQVMLKKDLLNLKLSL